MIFFELISIAFSSIFYGIIATVAIMAVLYGVLKVINKCIVQSPIFFLTGLVLAVLLVIQTSLMIGAFQAKTATDAAELFLRQQLEGCQGIVGAQESQQVMNTIIEEFPIIGAYANLFDFSGNDLSNLPQVMHETITSYLNTFIWHRVGWTLGFIVVSCIIVIMFAKPNKDSGRRQRDEVGSRHEGRRARTGDHQRVSRRR